MSMNLGINVVEVDGATPSIQGAPTSVAGFVIRSQRGVPGVVRQVSNFTQFTDYFGGFVAAGNDNPGTAVGTQQSYVGAYAIRGFFDNGGSMAYVSRVVDATSNNAAVAASTAFVAAASDGSSSQLVTVSSAFRGQADPGTWGNSFAVSLVVNPNANLPSAGTVSGFDLSVYSTSTVHGATVYKLVESWIKLVIGGAAGAQDPGTLNDPNTGSKYVMFASAPIAQWASGKYTAGAYVTNNGNVYRATTGGTSAATGGPSGAGASITDGGVTWAYVVPSITALWQPGHAYAVGNTVTVGGNVYQVTGAGTSAVSGPTGTASSITDGGVTWAPVAAWQGTHAYTTAGALVVTPNGNVYQVVTTGTSGSTGPTGTGSSITDGGVTWTFVASPAWQPSHAYTTGSVVTNAGHAYAVTTAGTSAAALLGPTGTGTGIADGSATWAYVAPSTPAGAPPGVATLQNGADDSLSGASLTTAFVNQLTVPSPFDPYDIELLACPESSDPGVILAACTYCINRGDCMFVGHVPDKFDVPGVKAWVKNHSLQGDKVYGALYYPYIQVVDPIGSTIWIPPEGHVMGVYARTDQQRGIWKAPAGNGALVDDALDVRTRITDVDHTDLVKNGSVNAIRPITGAGIVIDSSRTLSTNTLWLYVNVRLLFNYVKTSLKYGLRWVVQEPNSTELWNKIKFNSVTPFLMGLWRRGAFGPGAPADVFRVKVDAENNPPANIQQGLLNVEVYFYPSRPAETIIITVGQQEAGASAGES